MPRLIERLRDTVTVDYGEFMLMDLDGANGQPEGAQDLPELAGRANVTNWFVTTANLAMVISQASNWHVVDVTFELWDGKPPADDSEWIRNETAELYSSSGKLRLVETCGRSSEHVMDLHDQAHNWLVRASVRPGPGARKAEERPPEGLETYRLQFWRTRP